MTEQQPEADQSSDPSQDSGAPGDIGDDQLPLVMLAQFVAKVGVEVALTPVTYKVIAFLKRAEREDYYDTDTNFTPFSLRDT